MYVVWIVSRFYDIDEFGILKSFDFKFRINLDNPQRLTNNAFNQFNIWPQNLREKHLNKNIICQETRRLHHHSHHRHYDFSHFLTHSFIGWPNITLFLIISVKKTKEYHCPACMHLFITVPCLSLLTIVRVSFKKLTRFLCFLAFRAIYLYSALFNLNMVMLFVCFFLVLFILVHSFPYVLIVSL